MADAYIKGPVLGRGTFGEVIQATHKETGEVVAIKKIRVGEKGEGVNVTALREVKLLRELRSPHVVRLLDVFPHKKGISLVFEYCVSDLEAVIKDRSIVLSAADVKAYMQMVLRALDFCHQRWVVHRDVKPNNFLVASSGALKLADFGLARLYGSPQHKYTNQVFARWYRPPELLYGSTCYGPGVDIWAAGCIFAELLLRRPWFPGESDVEVLTKVFMALGTPQDEDWGGLRHMPSFVEFQATTPPGLRKTFPPGLPGATDDALDLLSRMMMFDASRRISAADALQHRYFRADPAPSTPEQLPKMHRQVPQQQQQQQGEGQDLGQPSGGGGGSPGGGPPANGSVGGDFAAEGGNSSRSAGQGRTGMTSVVRGMSLDAAPAADGRPAGLVPGTTSDPGSSIKEEEEEEERQQQQQQGITPGWGAPASALPESLQGRLERPRLGSEDIKYLRKRKLALDEALEEQAAGS